MLSAAHVAVVMPLLAQLVVGASQPPPRCEVILSTGRCLVEPRIQVGPAGERHQHRKARLPARDHHSPTRKWRQAHLPRGGGTSSPCRARGLRWA